MAYVTIDGQKYEKELLDLAKHHTTGRGESRLARDEVAELFASAWDGPGVTDTEKATLAYIRQTYPFTDAAAADFDKAFAALDKKKSYYVQIDGVRYERELIELAQYHTTGRGEGRLAKDEVAELFESAWDGQGVTETEKATLAYIRNHFSFTDAAAADFDAAFAELEEPAKGSYYVQIDGQRYERELIDLARHHTTGRGESRLAKDEVEALFASAQDGPGVTETEKATLAYIRQTFPFTDAAAADFDQAFGAL